MRYFVAALSALVLVLPAGSASYTEGSPQGQAAKHYFTVADNTQPMPNCPGTGLQVKCSTEDTWQSPPWTVRQCDEGASLEYRDESWSSYVYRSGFRLASLARPKRTIAWQCEKPADLADQVVRRTQVVTISGELGAHGCLTADSAQSSCVFHCDIGGWNDCDYDPKGDRLRPKY